MICQLYLNKSKFFKKQPLSTTEKKKKKDYPLHRESLKMVQMNLFTKRKSHRCKTNKQTLVMVISYQGEKEWGRDKVGYGDWHRHTTVYKIDN